MAWLPPAPLWAQLWCHTDDRAMSAILPPGYAGGAHEARVENRTEGKASTLMLGKHELIPQQL